MELQVPAHGVKQRQTALESGDYLSFKLPYRLNNPPTVHRPRDQAHTQNTGNAHTHPQQNPHTQW